MPSATDDPRPAYDPERMRLALTGRRTDDALNQLVAALEKILENQEKTIRLVRNLESLL